MNARSVWLVAALLLVVPAQIRADDDVPTLIHNPFNQPGLVMQQSGNTEDGVIPVWTGSLKAVLVAGSNSLANIEGELLAIGDLYEGYRLIRVEEAAVIFSKGEQRFVVRMASESDEDDNE